MVKISDKSKCCGCHACYSSCPKHCITMKEDEEGFLYPWINQDTCINCGLCEKVCPMFDTEKHSVPIDAYAAQCKDDKVLFESSSGGAFSALAVRILQKGGVVVGAAFSDDFKEALHIIVDNCDDLRKLRTSKYVQSRIGQTYQEVKRLLDEGKNVLFSGVPCQIAGLRKYLTKEYDNLFCVDVICHGVPSPQLLKRYLLNIEEIHHGTIADINFRHKMSGWQQFGIMKKVDGVEVFASKSEDPYMQMFLKNYSLRQSCYECQAKVVGSYADITLGDFWGIGKIVPQMDNGKGVSAVVINTAKGKQLYEEILSEMRSEKVLYEDIRKYNSPIYLSVTRPHERDTFYKDMNALTFSELAEKYCIQKHKSVREMLSGIRIWKIIRPVFRGGKR